MGDGGGAGEGGGGEAEGGKRGGVGGGGEVIRHALCIPDEEKTSKHAELSVSGDRPERCPSIPSCLSNLLPLLLLVLAARA